MSLKGSSAWTGYNRVTWNEAAVQSKDGANIAAALHKCCAYKEEQEIQENIATLYTQETTLNLKMPKFTVHPKSITIFEFKKEWLECKRATALTKQEGLAELKQAIQTTQRKAVLDMKEEE